MWKPPMESRLGRHRRCRRRRCCLLWWVKWRWQPAVAAAVASKEANHLCGLAVWLETSMAPPPADSLLRSPRPCINVPWCYSGRLASAPHLLKSAITDAAGRLGAPGFHEVVPTNVRKHSNKSVYQHSGYAEVKHLQVGRTRRDTRSADGNSMREHDRRIGKNSPASTSTK